MRNYVLKILILSIFYIFLMDTYVVYAAYCHNYSEGRYSKVDAYSYIADDGRSGWIKSLARLKATPPTTVYVTTKGYADGVLFYSHTKVIDGYPDRADKPSGIHTLLKCYVYTSYRVNGFWIIDAETSVTAVRGDGCLI